MVFTSSIWRRCFGKNWDTWHSGRRKFYVKRPHSALKNTSGAVEENAIMGKWEMIALEVP